MRYNGTGTEGVIKDIVEDEDGVVWVQIDRTELYYRASTLTRIDRAKAEKELEEIVLSTEEISERLEREAEAAPTVMDDTSLESGG